MRCNKRNENNSDNKGVSYGAHENKHALETLMRYSFEQGLAPRKVPLDEMFAKSIYELSKV